MRIKLNIYLRLYSCLEYGFYSHSIPMIPRDFHLLAQFIFHLALSNKEKQYGISIVVPNSLGKWICILNIVVNPSFNSFLCVFQHNLALHILVINILRFYNLLMLISGIILPAQV